MAPQNLPPYYASLYMLQRAASHGAILQDQGGAKREAWGLWRKVFAEHYQAGSDDLYETLVEHSRLMLTRRRGNPLRTWLAERKAAKLRGQLSSPRADR